MKLLAVDPRADSCEPITGWRTPVVKDRLLDVVDMLLEVSVAVTFHQYCLLQTSLPAGTFQAASLQVPGVIVSDVVQPDPVIASLSQTVN
nr:hypothetical protein GCM10020093_011490 [Planobispora longispora]